MPTTAWSVIRPDIARELGLVEFTITTAINADNVLVSTELADDFTSNDFFIGWYALITDEANAGVIKRVTDYVASSGTVTVAGAVLSDDGSDLAAVELHRFHPTRLLAYYNRARQELFPNAYLVRELTTIVTGQRQTRYTIPSSFRGGPIQVWEGIRTPVEDYAENEITDPSFENWANSTSLTSWSVSGTGATVNQQEQTTNPRNYMVLEGENSARVLSASSGAATLLQTVTPTVSTEAVEANLGIWVYCDAASRVSTQIAAVNGSGAGLHGGTGWELLTQSAQIADTATTLSVGLSCTAGGVISFYADEASLILGQTEPIDDGWDAVLNWQWVPPISGASNGGILQFPFRLREQRRLRLIGKDMLSAVSADTDTVEADRDVMTLVHDYVKMLAAREAATVGISGTRGGFWAERAKEFNDRVTLALITGDRLRMPLHRMKVPDA